MYEFILWSTKIFTIFKQWETQVENQTGIKVKYLKSNNGLKYKDTAFLKFRKIEDITY